MNIVNRPVLCTHIKKMSPEQKYIIELLLEGYTIAGNREYGIRLRTPDCRVVRKINERTWDKLKDILRREKSGLIVIDKRKVRQLHGNCIVKRIYKQKLKLKKENEKKVCYPCRDAQVCPEKAEPGDQQKEQAASTGEPVLQSGHQ